MRAHSGWASAWLLVFQLHWLSVIERQNVDSLIMLMLFIVLF